MKLFKISQKINTGWDTFSNAVVVADNEDNARKIHPDSKNKYFSGWPLTDAQKNDPESFYMSDWADTPDQVMVQYLGEAVAVLKEGDIVCASFHAG